METMQLGGTVFKIEPVETPKNGPCLRLTLRDEAGGTAILSKPADEMADFLRKVVSAGDSEARDLGTVPARLDVMGRTIVALPDRAAFNVCFLAGSAGEATAEVGDLAFRREGEGWTASIDLRLTFFQLPRYVEEHFPGLAGTND